jgi:uncharacterized protein (DUF2147 family)
MKRFIPIATAMGCLLATSVIHAEALPITGTWRTMNDEGKEVSEVQIYEQGGKLFGKITSLKVPNDDKGQPHKCTACKGADKDKPILGLVIIKNMALDGDEYTGGTIMDPDQGKDYGCKLEAIEGGKKLKVRGFLGISLLGRTQVWVKK